LGLLKRNNNQALEGRKRFPEGSISAHDKKKFTLAIPTMLALERTKRGIMFYHRIYARQVCRTFHLRPFLSSKGPGFFPSHSQIGGLFCNKAEERERTEH
jgi:hypothetical protein